MEGLAGTAAAEMVVTPGVVLRINDSNHEDHSLSSEGRDGHG